MKASPQQLADRLHAAYTSGPVAPLRDGLDPDDAAGAYAVQSINIRRWQQAGRRIVGRKIGLTARAAQRQRGIGQPIFGALFDDMRIADGGVLLAASVLQPRAEAEVALVLATDVLKADATAEDLMAASEHAIAAIEIVDSRIVGGKRTYADSVADNGASAFYVLGQQTKPLSGLDFGSCGMALEINGNIMSVGTGPAYLGHPLNAAAWLARILIANGDALRAGDLVLTGALGPMVTIKPGDQVVAQISGLGSVSFTYEANVDASQRDPK